MQFIRPPLVLMSACVCLLAQAAAPEPGTGPDIEIEWSRSVSDEKPEWFSVNGFEKQLVTELRSAGFSSAEWKRVFSVSIDQSDPLLAIEQPAMAGRYSATDSSLIFWPRFPLAAGAGYRATFNPEAIRDLPRSRKSQAAQPRV